MSMNFRLNCINNMESRYIYTCVAALNVILRHVFYCADGLRKVCGWPAQNGQTTCARCANSQCAVSLKFNGIRNAALQHAKRR